MKRDDNIHDLLHRFFGRFRRLPEAPVDAAWDRVLDRLAEEPDGASQHAQVALDSLRFTRPMPARFLWVSAAAALVLAVSLFALLFTTRVPAFEIVDGALSRTGGTIESGLESGGAFVLADGSRVEMHSGTELSLERATDGVRIRLSKGSILVNAAPQRDGRLHVTTSDIAVSVVGTVFLVNSEEGGSRVSVIEGEVEVQHGAELQRLLPGEQVTTAASAVWPGLIEDVAWSPSVVAHVALLRQSIASTPAAVPGETAQSIRGVIRHAKTGQPIADAQIQLMPARGPDLLPAVEAFFSTIAPGTQLTPALLEELNVAQSAGGRPATPVGDLLSGARRGGPAAPGGRGGAAALRPLMRATTSDAGGRFAFSDLAPGTYRVTVRRDGYSGPPSPGFNGREEVMTSPVVVAENRPTPEIAISMVRDGTIGGRIFDAAGDPLPKIDVSAYELKYDLHGRIGYSAVSSKTTDDLGEYRLFGLPPGEYWVGATPPPPGTMPSSRDSYTRTFFPGTTNPGVAARIELQDGVELGGIDIPLKPVNKYVVSGRVTGLPELATAQAAPIVSTLILLPLDRDSFQVSEDPSLDNLAADRSNGQFEVRGIAPGAYDLIAAIRDVSGRFVTGRTRIDVLDRDVTGVDVPVFPGVQVRARIVYVGDAPSATSGVWLRLRSIESYPEPFDDAVVVPSGNSPTQFVLPDASGTIVFQNVPPSRYTFQLAGLPDTAIVDVRESGVSVLHDGLRVGSSPPGLIEVVVNPSGETVEGIVYGANQKPLAGARVVLAPPLGRRQNAALYRTTTSDSLGRFTLQRIAPGEYKLFAWESAPPRNAYLNADYLSRYESGGRVFRVTPGGHSDLQITAMPGVR